AEARNRRPFHRADATLAVAAGAGPHRLSGGPAPAPRSPLRTRRVRVSDLAFGRGRARASRYAIPAVASTTLACQPSCARHSRRWHEVDASRRTSAQVTRSCKSVRRAPVSLSDGRLAPRTHLRIAARALLLRG